ncbi:hypothetical protein PR048_008853 [Dryococelus australis]|uniref:DUF5641 domain-containing protein n=1 Tax=Dryococelus australis TaxID=614101 RepID=A0ABQ9HYB3_9NEOP|nr:hypothetical protein PR048_008853 [Dryococelus australis]
MRLRHLEHLFKNPSFSVRVHKFLGGIWYPAYGHLQIASGFNLPSDCPKAMVFTKRTVLATIASVFDPLGLISPIVISCKILLQVLWQSKLDWDKVLPSELLCKWKGLYEQLPRINHIHIDIYVLSNGIVVDLQLHGFADASERGYGACVYIRSTEESGKVTAKLLCAKSKVARRLNYMTSSKCDHGPRQHTRKENGKTCCDGYFCATEIILRFSTLIRMKRVISYCIHLIRNTIKPIKEWKSVMLSAQELKDALITCIRIAQVSVYSAEVESLIATNGRDSKSKLKSLNPFICKDKILGMGRHLQHVVLQLDQKHQMILPPKHQLTRLIIEEEHRRLLHTGGQLWLSSLHQHYWIVNGKDIIRCTIHNCIVCLRFKAMSAQQLMGQLLSVQANPGNPFINVGIDYAIPLYIKSATAKEKWVTEISNIQPGNLVILRKDSFPPLIWKIGITEQAHPGPDGMTRVVTICTTQGKVKKSITKLCPLPNSGEGGGVNKGGGVYWTTLTAHIPCYLGNAAQDFTMYGAREEGLVEYWDGVPSQATRPSLALSDLMTFSTVYMYSDMASNLMVGKCLAPAMCEGSRSFPSRISSRGCGERTWNWKVSGEKALPTSAVVPAYFITFVHRGPRASIFTSLARGFAIGKRKKKKGGGATQSRLAPQRSRDARNDITSSNTSAPCRPHPPPPPSYFSTSCDDSPSNPHDPVVRPPICDCYSQARGLECREGTTGSMSGYQRVLVMLDNATLLTRCSSIPSGAVRFARSTSSTPPPPSFFLTRPLVSVIPQPQNSCLCRNTTAEAASRILQTAPAISTLASNQGESGSIPSRATGFSQVRIVPDDAGLSRGSPVSPASSFRRCSIFIPITPIGSQYVAVKSRPNLFTHLSDFSPTIENRVIFHLSRFPYLNINHCPIFTSTQDLDSLRASQLTDILIRVKIVSPCSVIQQQLTLFVSALFLVNIHRVASESQYGTMLTIELDHCFLLVLPCEPQVSDIAYNSQTYHTSHDGNTARLARRSDETLGVGVSVARIAPSLLDLGRAALTP